MSAHNMQFHSIIEACNTKLNDTATLLTFGVVSQHYKECMTVDNDNLVTPIRQCTTCFVKYPATNEYFDALKRGKYGLRAECKTCRRARITAYYRANSEYFAAYREANRDKDKARSMAWYEANRERANATTASYREANRERTIANSAAWKRANPDKVKASKHRRRARRNASTEHWTAADLALQYTSQRGKCWHCSIELNNTYEPDHLIPLSQGGTNAPNNIVCSCMPCNRSKGSKTVAQWKGMLV